MFSGCICALHYSGIFIASLLGAGVGSFMVLRFWKTDELDDDDRKQ